MNGAKGLVFHSYAHLTARSLRILWSGYQEYIEGFDTITRRAAERFERRDWGGMRHDTVERLELYPQVVGRTCSRISAATGLQAQDPKLWAAIKSGFEKAAARRTDADLACTFYNSVNRRMLQTMGIEPDLEFIEPLKNAASPAAQPAPTFELMIEHVTPESLETLLSHFDFHTPFAEFKTDARLCAERIQHVLQASHARCGQLRAEMVRLPFFREMGAYLIGRLRWDGGEAPLVFALVNTARGLLVDALLLRNEDIRILFSFSHTYFHVATVNPGGLVLFLKSLMPTKRTAELYIGLGYNKHGKTELYRDLLEHQRVCTLDRFQSAAGQPGMVMIAFNMPRDDLIYKLIRDRFASPKHATPQQVMEKYDYVFKHDRAGRLVDVQTFENLEIEDCCFAPELLAEIQSEARRTTSFQGSRVILHHVYVERRLIPLDLYLQQADAASAEAAVIDYGRAIKDLARINVFPGDLLIKNFGVTTLGRVVFYDYDELCPLTDCNFRRLPQARRYEDELASEPWFMVGENDVFPEEFASFLGLPPGLRRIFLQHHHDLLTPEFWQHVQDQIRSGLMTPILPYPESQRLRRAG